MNGLLRGGTAALDLAECLPRNTRSPAQFFLGQTGGKSAPPQPRQGARHPAGLEDGVPLARLAREHGMQLRRLQRWMRAYRQEGLGGLAFHSRADQGRRRRLSGELEQVIEGLALRRPPLSHAAVHR